MKTEAPVALLMSYGFEGYHHNGPDLMGRMVVFGGDELYQTGQVGSLFLTGGRINEKTAIVGGGDAQICFR